MLRGNYGFFEVFGGALNRAEALTRPGVLIKTDENVDPDVDSELLGQEKEKMDWLYLCIYHGHSPLHQVSKTLKNELCKAMKLYTHMQIEVPDTPVTKKVCF